jgi:hypothetical protein
MILKLHGVCYAFRQMIHPHNTDTAKTIYSAQFLSAVKNEVICAWVNLPLHKIIFALHNKIQIMAGTNLIFHAKIYLRN